MCIAIFGYPLVGTEGERLSSLAERVAKLRKLIASAPRILPLFAHRFLLVLDPNGYGNPVLSMAGLDIIQYGSNLPNYLMTELKCTLSVPELESISPGDAPFWGPLIR